MAKVPYEVRAAAISADCFRFPQSANFDHWFSYPALTVEEIAALSCDRDPEILNPRRIAEFELPTPHPLLARNQQGLMGMSAIAIAFNQRRDFLLRACRHGDLPATPAGDTYEVRLADFFPWLDRQGGKDPWDLLPDEIEERLKEFRGAASDAEKGNAAAYSFGVFKAAKDDAEARDLIKSETRKPLEERQFKTRMALKDQCAKLGAGWQAFKRLYEGAEKMPGFIPFKKGRPAKDA